MWLWTCSFYRYQSRVFSASGTLISNGLLGNELQRYEDAFEISAWSALKRGSFKLRLDAHLVASLWYLTFLSPGEPYDTMSYGRKANACFKELILAICSEPRRSQQLAEFVLTGVFPLAETSKSPGAFLPNRQASANVPHGGINCKTK